MCAYNALNYSSAKMAPGVRSVEETMELYAKMR